LFQNAECLPTSVVLLLVASGSMTLDCCLEGLWGHLHVVASTTAAPECYLGNIHEELQSERRRFGGIIVGVALDCLQTNWTIIGIIMSVITWKD